jgi:hypothetical protein
MALEDHTIKADIIDDRITINFEGYPETAFTLKKYQNSLLEENSERTAFSKFWKADLSIFC